MGIQYSIVVDTGCAGIHHSKYWMPIHYDIEDGPNKTSHRLFSNYTPFSHYTLSRDKSQKDGSQIIGIQEFVFDGMSAFQRLDKTL